jgi:hypothetical protein
LVRARYDQAVEQRRWPTPVAIASRAWPVPLILAASIVVQKTFFESRYDVSGHASGHLMSAGAPFFAGALIAILLWATPAARRQADVAAGSLAWFAATVLVMVGNLRVVDDLLAAGLGRAPTEGLPDVADHGLANAAPWLAVVAALALTGALWRRRHVSNRVAAAAVVLNVLFPPWIIPGAGVVVLVGSCILARVTPGLARPRLGPEQARVG